MATGCVYALRRHWVPAGFKLKRRSAACRFVVLIAAAFCAGSIWFVPASRLWKDTRVTAAKAVRRSRKIDRLQSPLTWALRV